MGTHSISIPHFYCLEYKEDNRTMVLDIDFRDPVIYLNSALITHWAPPDDGVAVLDGEKKRILMNIYNELLKRNSPGRIVLEEDD